METHYFTSSFFLFSAFFLFGACSGNKMTLDEKSLDNCPVVAQRQMIGGDSVTLLHVDKLKDTLDISLSQLLVDFEIIGLDSLSYRDTAANRPAPVFTIPSGTDEIPICDYMGLPDYYLAEIATKSVKESAAGSRSILVDKRTLQGAYFNLVNDFLGNTLIPAPISHFRDGRFTACVSAGNLINTLETALAKPETLSGTKKQKLTELKNAISTGDRDYLLTGKLKSGTEKLTISSESVPISFKSGKKAIAVNSTEQENSNIPYNTAYLENWKSYFRTNNKYKDWDSKDAKRTIIKANIDKYGKPHDVRISSSCGVKKLDEEAMRLIQEATTILPAKNEKGQNIEHVNWVIPVYFPPK